MQLARKFLLAIVSVAVLVLTIGVWASINSEVELHAADVARDHALIGAMLAHLIDRIPPDHLSSEGPEIARSAFSAREHLRARLLRLNDPAGAPVDEDVFRRALEGRAPVIAARSERSGMVVTVVPLASGEMAVELQEPISDEDALLRRIAVRFVLISIGLTAGFVIATSYLGRRFIGGPMRLLVRQARDIGEGRLGEATHLEQNDEIGVLARELNAMASRLRAADERARAENSKRLLAVEQLRHADRLATVGTLASGIAHELGTPLSVVEGRAALIEEAASEPDLRKSARVITEQVHRMTRIVRQVLDFARRSTPKATRVSLRDLLEKAATLLAPIARKHAVEIHILETAPTFVMADPGLMHQVLMNILVNAVQASAGRSDAVEARVLERDATPPGEPGAPEGRYGCVVIEDRGNGIPQDQLRHVFEPFFTTKDVGEGTGLGLSVAWGIVQDHGGWIDVDSEIGRGTTFRIHLPLAPEPA